MAKKGSTIGSEYSSIGKGGGSGKSQLTFSGKYQAVTGGDGSSTPPTKNPSGTTVSKAPGTQEKATGPSCGPTETHTKGRY